MSGDKESLDEHKNNILTKLIGDSFQNKTEKDPVPELNENKPKEKIEKTANTVGFPNSESNNKEAGKIENVNEKENSTNGENSENNGLKSINSDLIQEPLSQFVDNLDTSNQTQTKEQVKDQPKEDENKPQNNSTDEKIETKTNSEINQSQTISSSRSQDSSKYSQTSQSSSYYTERSIEQNNSKNANTKTQRNSQPPKLQGKLPQIVFHSPDSLTYKALTLQPLPPMNRQTRSSVVLDLSTYIDQCSQEGLIAEANFILEVSESVKKIQTPRKIEMQQMQLKDNLDNCNSEIEAQISYWDEQEKIANNDYIALVEELDSRLNTELELLDREWQDPKKYSAYSKPSPALLNYRYVANKLIQQKNFSSIPQLSKIIFQKHDEEVKEASRRMESDYKLAESNLMAKYKKERETIEKIHQSKLDNLARMKERSLGPIQSRKKLMETKSNRLKSMQANNSQSSKLPSPVIQSFDNTVMNELIANPKLKLPPMKTKNRAATSLSKTTNPVKRKSDSVIMQNKSKSSMSSPFLSAKGSSTHVPPRSLSRHDFK